MDLGGELRAARQALARSIDDLSSATKISPTVLRAIEQNAFDTIPRGVFTRGYLSAYAREVGLDPGGIVQRYRDEFEPAAPTREASGEPNAPDVSADAVDFGDESAGTRQSRMLQVAVILVVAVAYLASLRTPKPATDAAPPPIAAAAVVPAAEVPVGTSGSTNTPGHLAILIQPHGPCWVDATVDGEHTVARLMDAGDRESIACATA